MNPVVTPYNDADRSKKEQVAQMFDSIAGRYDFLNHFLSMGIDVLWRRKAVRMLKQLNPKVVVDIATGTGDFAIEALKLNPEKIIGLDISTGMLEIGKKKVAKVKGGEKITMEYGDSENLSLASDSVDAITVGFGVRNFENLEKGLGEMLRVLRKGGKVAILEPAIPTRFPMKQLFFFYFRWILPTLGRLVSGNSVAYTYLPESVRAFPNGNDFVTISKKVGFSSAIYKPLTLGICSLYLLEK